MVNSDLFQTKAVEKRLPGGARLFLGTSGYSFPHWRGVFYPERIAGKDWLRYYALKFNSVEINSTYYGILSEKAAAAMAGSVPAGFSFSVKLHSSMTHERNAERDQWERFHRMLEPLRRSGKMGMVLAQFPWSFPLEEGSFRWLSRLAGNLEGLDTAIEFRHRRWYGEEPLKRVLEMGFVPVSVDLPVLPGLPSTGLLTQGGKVYLRLHGRNRVKWWGNTQERYDYLYGEDELRGWAETLRNLSDGASSCYVFFNNCHMGKAALNARDMERLLSGSPGG
jgi:uncharacterized protein YecE (DUF72 family)